MLPLLLSPVAFAHDPGLSAARLSHRQLDLTVASAEAPAAEAVWGRLSVTSDGAACRLIPHPTAVVDGDGLRYRADLDCPDGAVWTLHAGHLELFPPGHRLVVEAFGTPQGLVHAGATDLSIAYEAQAAGPVQVGSHFAALGVEHIATGWDHLAFLLALLVVARSAREMLAVVTGFTLAHSVTLSAGALGVVNVPVWIVEPIIALSITAVALENLVTAPPLRRRIATTFALGLIHGLGFAGMLTAIGLPEGQSLLALAAFNGGVEVGQLLIVALCLPVLAALRRSQHAPAATRWVSGGLAVAGLVWFVQRL